MDSLLRDDVVRSTACSPGMKETLCVMRIVYVHFVKGFRFKLHILNNILTYLLTYSMEHSPS